MRCPVVLSLLLVAAVEAAPVASADFDVTVCNFWDVQIECQTVSTPAGTPDCAVGYFGYNHPFAPENLRLDCPPLDFLKPFLP